MRVLLPHALSAGAVLWLWLAAWPPSPVVLAVPSPTPDRLAAPPTVENPTQADQGAQAFWLNCQPCHGDRGQGLTDEWRAQYPPEDQNCWEAGCHGERPYESGFTIPRNVPAVIGPGTLQRFPTAAELYVFTRAAMPFQAPGSLSDDEYWALTAFLMRARGLPESALPLTSPEQAARYAIGPTATPTPNATPIPSLPPAGPGSWLFVPLGLLLGAATWLGLRLWRRRIAASLPSPPGRPRPRALGGGAGGEGTEGEVAAGDDSRGDEL